MITNESKQKILTRMTMSTKTTFWGHEPSKAYE